MLKLDNIGVLGAVVGMLSACTVIYSDFDRKVTTTSMASETCHPVFVDSDHTICAEDVGTDSYPAHGVDYKADGVAWCLPSSRCPDGMLLPPQPCAQPMPEYYGNVSQDIFADGVVLIHPYTRTQVICFDQPQQSAADCANNFRAAGYVLITDIPQQPAKYDFLRKGTYPTRKWRNGGEVVPRF